MLLTCPNCSTRYLVSDTAIGVEGRRVRCSQCKHSWFQNAPESLLADPNTSLGVPESSAPPPPPPSWATDAPPRFEEAPEPATRTVADDFDPFVHAPPFRPRRNPAKMWTAIAVTVGVLLLALNVTLWMAGGFGSLSTRISSGSASDPASLLRLERVGDASRRQVEGGHEVLELTGRIRNPTGDALTVPDIRASLLGADGRILYGWTIPAPIRRLEGGGTATFTGATIDAPQDATGLTLTFVARPAG